MSSSRCKIVAPSQVFFKKTVSTEKEQSRPNLKRWMPFAPVDGF